MRRIRPSPCFVAAAACSALLTHCSCEATLPGAEALSHGRFERVYVYRPPARAQRLALLLSGDGGWSSGPASIAQRLTGSGTLVAGIDTRQLLRSLGRDAARCVSPGAELADLALYVQKRYQLPAAPPVLLGHSAGATLALVALAQAPAGTFAGALTLSFCAELDLEKPLCRTPALAYSAAAAGSVRLLPAGPLPAPWIALHALDDSECPAPAARAFVAAVPGARFVGLAGVTHNYRHSSRWWEAFETAYRQLAAAPQAPAAPLP